jgi:hypothetical protein
MENPREGGAIDAAVGEKRDLLLAGSCGHACGHALPPDISWGNFLYYREKLASIA